MLVTREYDRLHAKDYALRWANGRNPLFYNYSDLGGDCTNFASQVIFAGSCAMNFTPTFGWYYLSESERSPSWTGVEFLYNFLTSNTGEGPFASEVAPGLLQEGDIIQFGNAEGRFYHTVVVTGFAKEGYLVSAHSYDAQNRPLITYEYYQIRYLHIGGVRLRIPDSHFCFENLISGTSIDL